MSSELKPGWKMAKFGDVAQNVVERADPAHTEADVYVGLEHLDSDTLHLHRWGHPSDVIGEKLVFKKGDIIFGKRRAYQRKLAIAEFDGICSAHAMVLRPKPERVWPDFFPFFLQTDVFMNRAIEISVGSLSPTINWGTLRDQEFALPPINEQKRIAELLWAADDAVNGQTTLHERVQQLYRVAVEKLLFDSINPEVAVGDLAVVNRESLSVSRTPKNYAFRYIDIGSVTAPGKLGETVRYVFSDAPSRARRVVHEGDILLSTVRPNLRSFVRIGNVDELFVASTGFAVLSPKTSAVGSILYHSFFSERFASFCEARMTGTNYPAISTSDISSFRLRVPRSEQRRAAIQDELDRIDKVESEVELHVSRLARLHRRLINESVGAGGESV